MLYNKLLLGKVYDEVMVYVLSSQLVSTGRDAMFQVNVLAEFLWMCRQ